MRCPAHLGDAPDEQGLHALPEGEVALLEDLRVQALEAHAHAAAPRGDVRRHLRAGACPALRSDLHTTTHDNGPCVRLLIGSCA